MTVDRKLAGKEAKKKQLIEQQRLRLEDLEEKEALDNAGLLEESDLDSEDRAYLEEKKKDLLTEGKDIESSGESEDEGKSLFVNPLTKKSKGKAEESEEWSDDDIQADGTKVTKKKDKVLGKRKRKGSIDNVQDFFHNEAIEEVPLNDPGTKE